MSVPFSFPGSTARRQPFIDFNTDVAVMPTVGLNKDSDLNVYVCDDVEELRRLGPRQPQVTVVPGLGIGGSKNGSPQSQDLPRGPGLTGGEGVFAKMFANGSPKNERDQIYRGANFANLEPTPSPQIGVHNQ